MGATLLSNLSDAQRQNVNKKLKNTYEMNTPGIDEIKKSTKKMDIDEAGYRIRQLEVEPGGHGFYSGASSSYNEPFPAQSVSMWVYPVRYALAMQYDVALLESLKEGKSEFIIKLLDVLNKHVEAGAKRMNQMLYGIGDAALAYSATTIATSGTVNCETAAALTAGHTKGAVRLKRLHKYQAINPATGAVRGTFQVTTPGKTSFVMSLISGTIASGDPIVDIGSYMNAPRGFAQIFSPTNRILQGIDTSLHPDYNCPEVDLAGAVPSPADVETIKTKVATKRNDSEVTLKCFTTRNNMSVLRQQGFGYRMMIVSESAGTGVSTGVPSKYIENGVKYIEDADCDEDRFYFMETADVERFVEKDFDVADFDGNEWRMWLGANGYGSDLYLRALTWRGNYGLDGDGRSGALIRRANQTNTVAQTNA